MDKKLQIKLLQTLLGLFLAIFLIITSGSRIPRIDAQADKYFTEAIKKAGVAYATCRVVNASVSILKESSLKLEPAGIGLSLAVGQVLDPIDDMTERLSDVLVTAITSLGVQKLVYEMSLTLVAPILAGVLGILSSLLWFDNQAIERVRQKLIGVVLILLIVRLCLPLSSMVNQFIDDHFFNEQVTAANEQLSLSVKELDQFKEVTLPQIDGLVGTIENSAKFLKEKARALNLAFKALGENTGNMIQTLLTLTFLYVGLFFIQVLALPLLTFWLLKKVTDLFFYPRAKGDTHAVCEH